MAAPKLTKVLWPHLADGWDDIADLATPGLAAKLAAVRAGEATTSTLPVTAAAKLAGELGERAAAGDERVAVREALGAARPAKASKRRTPSEKLFGGTPAEVTSKLAGRRSITLALAVAYRDAAPEVCDATWDTMLARGNARVAAEVFAERAEHRGLEGVAQVAAMLTQLRTTNASNITPVPHRVATAARSVGAAWLSAWGDPGHHVVIPDGEDEPFELSRPPASGTAEAVGALSAICEVVFCGPAQLTEGVLWAAREGHLHTQRPALLSAGHARAPWEAISDSFALEDASAHTLLTALATLAEAGHARGVAAGIEDFYGGSHELGWYTFDASRRADIAAILTCAAPHTDPRAALRLWLSAVEPDQHSATWAARRARDAEALTAALSDAYADTTDAVIEVLGDPAVAGVLSETAATLLAASANRPDTAALRALHRAIFAAHPAERVAAAATAAPTAAWVRTWANHIDQLIGVHATSGEHRRDLWSAVLAVLDGFAGTTAEAVEVAAAVHCN